MDIRGEVIAILPRLSRSPDDVVGIVGTTDDVIDAFSRRTGIRIPIEFRDWLHICNGALIGAGGVYGIDPKYEGHGLGIEYYYLDHPQWRDRGWIPIAGDGCGNSYFIDVRDPDNGRNPIFFIDMSEPDMPDFYIASNLWVFLRLYFLRDLREKQWPRTIEELFAEDPELQSYGDIPLYPTA